MIRSIIIVNFLNRLLNPLMLHAHVLREYLKMVFMSELFQSTLILCIKQNGQRSRKRYDLQIFNRVAMGSVIIIEIIIFGSLFLFENMYQNVFSSRDFRSYRDGAPPMMRWSLRLALDQRAGARTSRVDC